MIERQKFKRSAIAVALLVGASISAEASASTTSYDYSRALTDGIVSVTDPNNSTTDYYVDEVDNLVKIVTGSGDADEQIFDYFYDATDQLEKITYPGGEQIFGYDALDRLETVKDFNQFDLLQFSYDHKDRITWIIYPAGNGGACYEYDPDSRITAVGRVAAGEAITASSLCSESRVNRHEYDYDTRGRIYRLNYPNGVYTQWDYDTSTGQLEEVGHYRVNTPSDTTDDTLIYNDTFVYFPNSQLYKEITRTNSAGAATTTRYTYDAYQRLKTVTEPDNRYTVFEYDSFGNRTKETITNTQDAAATGGTPKAYGIYTYVYYPNSNRLKEILFAATASTTATVQESFIYDTAGRLINRTHSQNGATTYTFDNRGLLTAVTTPADNISYSYDALGVRKTKTVNGQTTNYVTANIFGLPRVLMEYDAGTNGALGSAKVSYLYGGGQQLMEESTTGSALYLLHDGIVGSVTHVLDQNAVIKSEFQYDAFGNQTQISTTAGLNNYGYTGEEYEAESGLLYLRARYYDPDLGRFISNDPYLGRLEEPVTQNRYIYVRNNPLIYTDPSGNYAELGIEAASLTMGTSSFINNISDGNYFDAFVDAVGVVGDACLALVPGAPGVIGMGIQASRAGSNAVTNRGGDFVDLTTSARRRHILDGDRTGGGHRPGTGQPGKSEFPAGRSDDSIMHDISDIATDPTLRSRAGRGGRTITDGTRNGVDIRVIQERNGDIVTGFPTNTPRNPR